MSTPHNDAKVGEIAKTVIMPGDPFRAKFIAENFLEDYKLVNSVRGMYTYTGKYNGKLVSVMPHGMGNPSIGIYCYELYKIYNVENIIRVGSCGAYSKDLKLFDIILSKNVFSESNFALTMNNEDCHQVPSSHELNNIIEKTANEIGIKIDLGNTVCTDCFDLYMTDVNQFLSRIPSGFNPLAVEMEAFALFYTAKVLNKKAACLMSVVDSKYITEVATSEQRQTGLTNMIKVALEAATRLD
ncbi:MAG: purine-nucleoside phosphorylase [Clostridia bacterium]|nr:purine-nucleoside phosphorylase [Clostridia bacterium]